MTRKTLFPIELNEGNKNKKDFLINRFSQYVNLAAADLLEIGIGNGRFGYLLGQRVAHYYGVDVDREYVEIARTNIPLGALITYSVGSAEVIPFERQFDVVFYAHSWHLIQDFQGALKEAERVLKPNGIVAILEPSKNSSWASARLRRGSPQFEEGFYKRKMQDLERGRSAILEQDLFSLVEDGYHQHISSYFSVLRGTSTP